MYKRELKPLKTNSFFLFGARGAGKSTLVRSLLGSKNVLEIDLLDPIQFEEATLGLSELIARIEDAVSKDKWIFIDEVQRASKLLDVAQSLIDKRKAKFALSGSSARKLKRGAGNMLAGRAYTYFLYPLLSTELKNSFDLNTHLAYGGLPHVWNVSTAAERVMYLRSYVTTYLKEEISEEQIVRKLEPFTKFLQVAAQSSGQLVNYKKISEDIGVSDQTVKTYFHIMEDTLIGYLLPAFSRSIRKSQGKSPKFYLFDTGVLRALRRTVDQPLTESNYQYGNLFEHFIIGEIKTRAQFLGRDYLYSFLRLANDDEIDLIIDRPGKPLAAIEIKSTTQVKEDQCKVLRRLGSELGGAELFLLSRDKHPKQFGPVKCLHWESGIQEII